MNMKHKETIDVLLFSLLKFPADTSWEHSDTGISDSSSNNDLQPNSISHYFILKEFHKLSELLTSEEF